MLNRASGHVLFSHLHRITVLVIPGCHLSDFNVSSEFGLEETESRQLSRLSSRVLTPPSIKPRSPSPPTIYSGSSVLPSIGKGEKATRLLDAPMGLVCKRIVRTKLFAPLEITSNATIYCSIRRFYLGESQRGDETFLWQR